MNQKQRYKIFSLDYLQNEEFTDEDLKWLFDTKSFTLSLIVGEFGISENNLDDTTIVELVKRDNKWMYKYFWTAEQREQFWSVLVDCFKNLYSYDDNTANAHAGMWLVQYGLTDIQMKGKKIQTLCD